MTYVDSDSCSPRNISSTVTINCGFSTRWLPGSHITSWCWNQQKKKKNDRSVLFSIQQLHSTLQSLMQAALSPHCLEHAGKAPLGCARYCATWALPCSAFVATACIMTLTSQAVVTKNVMYPDQFGIRGQRFYCCQQGVVICIVNNALLDRDE